MMQRATLILALCFAHAAAEPSPCLSDDRVKPIKKGDVAAPAKDLPQLKKIFYINLPKSGFRRGRMEQLLKHTAPNDVPTERFEAVGKTLAKKADLTEFTQLGLHSYMPEVYKGDKMWATVGVYLSHARLLKKILADHPESNDMFMILEDDAIPRPNWSKIFMKEIMPNVPEDWDMIRLGYGTNSFLRCEDKISEGVYENREPTRSPDNSKGFYTGNTAYIVRPKSIPKILAQIASMPVLDVDGTMISREGGMRVYGVSDQLVYHGNGMGTSDRMTADLSPFSLAQTTEEEVTLDSVINDSVEAPKEKEEEKTRAEMAYESFQMDSV